MKINQTLAIDALKVARRVVFKELDSLLDSYAIGGRDDPKDMHPRLSVEGAHYAKPLREALRKIDRALASAK